ncbi:uncharacterized protein LOC135950786 [Calliphora vicina]|uniref:uncharacterized protein LOC135950786 n=1 Tax=Calliphora vicina TaxID=7373 RepID=UPI00325B9D80
MFVGGAIMYVPAISWLVLSYNWSFEITESFTFRPWRLIILFSMLPGFIGALMLLPLPESPKLLLAHDKQEEALKALSWISEFNCGQNLETVLKTSEIYLKPEELADADLLEMDTGFTILSKIWKATVPLFYKPHGMNVIIAVIALLSSMFCASGMQVWFPEIVNRITGGSVWGSSSTLCEILDKSYRSDRLNVTNEEGVISDLCDDTISTETYINNMILGLALLIGFCIQGLLLGPLGRKNILIVNIAVGALCGILLLVVSNSTIILILLILSILVPDLSVTIICSGIVDLVPTHFRGKAVSLGFTLGRIGTIVATNLIGAMLQHCCVGVFGLITCVNFGKKNGSNEMKLSNDQHSRSISRSVEKLNMANTKNECGDLPQKESASVKSLWDYEDIFEILAGDSVRGNSSTLCEILDASYRSDCLNVSNEEAVISDICDDTISTETYINNMILGLAFLIGFCIQGLLLGPLCSKNVLIGNLAVGALCGILLHVVSNTTIILLLSYQSYVAA